MIGGGPKAAPAGEDRPGQSPSSSRVRAWLPLFRIPNLFTVPGDPLMGFVLGVIVYVSGVAAAPAEVQIAAGQDLLPPLWRAVPAMLAALALYIAGLLANDYFDLEEDRRDRPSRPLPSGAVRPAHVLGLAVLLTAAGVGLGSAAGGVPGAVVAAGLAGLVWLYNVGGKRLAGWNYLNMGLCRGASILLGVVAAVPRDWLIITEPVICIFFGGMTLYIAAVTAIASRETRQQKVGMRRFLPVIVMAAWLLAMHGSTGMALVAMPAVIAIPSVACQILSIGAAGRCAKRLAGTPTPAVVQQTIGRLIRCLLLVQAGIVILAADAYWPLYVAFALLLASWPASAILARRLYAS